MKISHYLLFLTLLIAATISCSTGPEFERDNPYDRNPEFDSLGVLQFPPSYPNKYIFTGSGLKLNLFGKNIRLGEFIILRRNGSFDYEIIDTVNVISRADPVFAEYYLDTEIIHPEDIGYPLGYGIIYNSGDYSRYIDINFGNALNVEESTESDQLIVSWQDSVFLNNGFLVLRSNNGQIQNFIDLTAPDTSFSIPLTEEYLSSEYLISPYTYLHSEKTYLDTTYYYPKSPPPNDFKFEIISGEKFKLSWDDNSSIETGYKIIDNNTNNVLELQADQDSIVFEEKLSPFDRKSFTIYAMLDDRLSTPVNIDTTIPDFPYPKITGLKHLNEYTFELYFEDRVQFERKLYFSTDYSDSEITVENTKRSARISIYTIDAFSLDFSADLSQGVYGSRRIPISLRPSLEKLEEIELDSNSNPKTLDIRTIGNSLIFNSENHIYKTDLTTFTTPSNPIVSLPANVNLLRLSNNNSKAFASTTENTFYFIDVVNGSYENLTNLPESVYDVSFIEDDSKIVISTNIGLISYSLESKQSSELENFSSNAELEFYGDASQARLLALDRENYELHYFNTDSEFEYFNTSILDRNAIDGYSSELTNVSHLSSRNNVVGYKIGGGVEFGIDVPDCGSGIFRCTYGYHDRYFFLESNSSWDRNAYFQILDSEYRIASTENHLRIVSKSKLANIHVIKREPVSVSMLKINFDRNLAVEFHENTKTLVFYDLSKKWSFTNYGEYFDLAWPSN